MNLVNTIRSIFLMSLLLLLSCGSPDKNDQEDASGQDKDRNEELSMQDGTSGDISEDDYNVYFERALEQKERGNFNEALTNFDKAIALKPDESQLFVDRAILKSETGDAVGAIEDYNKVLELSPEHANTYNNLGIILTGLPNYSQERAIYILKEYFDFKGNIQIKEGVNSAEGNTELKNLIYNKAIEYFDKSIQIEPEHDIAYGNKGLAQYYLGETDKACETWEKAHMVGDVSAINYLEAICD